MTACHSALEAVCGATAAPGQGSVTLEPSAAAGAGVASSGGMPAGGMARHNRSCDSTHNRLATLASVAVTAASLSIRPGKIL